MTAGEEIRERAELIVAEGKLIDAETAADVRAFAELCRSDVQDGELSDSDRDLLFALCELVFDDEGSSPLGSKDALKLQADIYRLLADGGRETDLVLKCGYLNAVEGYAYEATIVPEEKFEENAGVLEYLNAAFAFYESMSDEEKQDVSVRVKLSILYERIGLYIRKKSFFKEYFEPEDSIRKYIGGRNSEGMGDLTTVSFVKSYYRHLKMFTDSILKIYDHDYAASCFSKLIGYCREAEEQGGGDEAKLYLFLSVCRFAEIALYPEMSLYISHIRREDALSLRDEGNRLYEYLKDKFPGSELDEAQEGLNRYRGKE